MSRYSHSVVLDEEKCKGCTNCMRRCPNEAIRIVDRKAVIIKNRCIDCGECIKVCPYHAQNAETDNLDMLNKFKYNVAIPAVSMYGQFTKNIGIEKIYSGIKKLGFDYVYDEGIAADLSSVIINKIIEEGNTPKPLISSQCPTIVRLIQIRFPSLMDNIVRIESPMEIAAKLAREKIIEEKGLKKEEIGVFYLTSCPAKVTSVRNPIGIKKSNVNGAISIKKIYGNILRNTKTSSKATSFPKASSLGVGWANVGGQSKAIGVKDFLAVDGIENVIKVLEEIELGKLNNVDYFECYACTGGCVGGVLNVENPFIAQSRIRKIYNNNSKFSIDEDYAMKLYKNGSICWTEKVNSKEVMKLDENIESAIKKMEMIKDITDKLPGLDCGSCGAPSCRALAEDITKGFAKLEDCIFISKNKANK